MSNGPDKTNQNAVPGANPADAVQSGASGGSLAVVAEGNSLSEEADQRPVAGPPQLQDVKDYDSHKAAELAPTEDQVFYLRVLARYLCSRKGIKTLTLADSAEIKGELKQKENKAQAFLNRYTRGPEAATDYRAFRKGVRRIWEEYLKKGVDLFDDPIMRQAFAVVFPDPNDDSFIDAPLLNWFSVKNPRCADVWRSYWGLWWIVRPSSSLAAPEALSEFNVALLNIVPEGVPPQTQLPSFRFRQLASRDQSVSAHGRLLPLDNDQVLLLGKRRGSQTPTHLGWRYNWDPDRRLHESSIRGALSTVNTRGVPIHSHFYGCYIEGTDLLRGTEFDQVDEFLKRFVGIRVEDQLSDIPTSLEEVRMLLPLQPTNDEPPRGLSAVQGARPSHRPIVSPGGLDMLRAAKPGPILTVE